MSAARPENQLLIRGARQHLDSANEEQIRRLLGEDLDWNYLLTTANRHGVIPFLYNHLNAFSAEVPHQTMTQLRDLGYEISRSNFALTGELIKFLDLLGAHDVEAIPFKGPTLAQLAYGDPGLRQFIDLDVLIRKQDVIKVSELLIDQGFKPELELTRAQRAALLRFDSACTFTNDRGVVLDVHWDFVERYFAFQIDTDRLWDRLAHSSLGGKLIPTLSSEDLLLVLCLHGFTHNWERLGWICDVAALIESETNIDWDILLKDAIRLGNRRVLSLGLFLAAELLNAPVPQEVWKTAPADSTVKALGNKVQQQLFAELKPPAGILDEIRLQVRIRERNRDKLRACFRLAATPRSYDWMIVSVPASLSFLYYLIRPIRLAGKYTTKLLTGAANTIEML